MQSIFHLRFRLGDFSGSFSTRSASLVSFTALWSPPQHILFGLLYFFVMKFPPSSSLNRWFSRLLLWLCFSHVRGHPLRCPGHSCSTTLSYRTDIVVTILFLQLEIFQLPGIMRGTQFTRKFWILRDGILNCFYWLALLWQQRWPGLPAPAGWRWEASRDTSAHGEVWELHSSSPCDVHPHRQ